MGALLHGVMMGTFLLAGRLRSRVQGQAIITRDLVFNMFNGLALFGVRLTGITWVTAHLQLGLLPTDWLASPWLQGIVGFLLLDLSRYWLHYAGHRVPFLWSFHHLSES